MCEGEGGDSADVGGAVDLVSVGAAGGVALAGCDDPGVGR